MQNIPETKQNTPLTGTVISYFGNSVAVEGENEQVFPCHLKRNQALPVVGDNVLWQLESDDSGIILEIMPRKSVLMRGDSKGKSKAIAANIDNILIVMAPPPIFSEYLVDRYLIAAELLAITPVIVINKCDLLTAQTEQALKERLQPYLSIGYVVLLTSVYGQIGYTF